MMESWAIDRDRWPLLRYSLRASATTLVRNAWGEGLLLVVAERVRHLTLYPKDPFSSDSTLKWEVRLRTAKQLSVRRCWVSPRSLLGILDDPWDFWATYSS